MKIAINVYFFIFTGLAIFAQDEFDFAKGADKVSVRFKMINNLIFVPIKVNGVALNFLIDSGVEETILFSMEDKKEVSFQNIEKITLRGLGSNESIEGLKSTNNILDVNGLKSLHHQLYIVLDQSFNLSSHVGIPVNGIIGYGFLKSNLVEINYSKKRIVVYKNTDKIRKYLNKKYEVVPIKIERSKPYLSSLLTIVDNEIPAKLLIDVGNSDGLWLFANEKKSIVIPKKNFSDYLGQGFSGEVLGKRAQIKRISFSKFEFNLPIAAFPDSSSVKNVRMVRDRAGSVGAEIMKRFNVVFDYRSQQLFLKKNKYYADAFTYNKSGLELQHYGLQWVQETVKLETLSYKGAKTSDGVAPFQSDFKYKFVLKPVYKVVHVRENSPAANCGLKKDDVIISINNKPGYAFTLEKINTLLKSEEEDWISFEIERETQIFKFKFQLLNTL